MAQVTFEDYGYTNARIRAMRGNLLTASFYEELLGMTHIDDVLVALEHTPYKEEIQQCILRGGTPVEIDEALKRNIARTFTKIQSFVDKEAKELLGLLLSRWDVYNIKTVLRGKHMKIADDEIGRSLIPAGRLDDVTLQELAKQPDVVACVDLLATWQSPYARPLTEGLPGYIERDSLVSLELALDKYFYNLALHKTKGRSLNLALVREIIEREIDIINIITLLRTHRASLSPEEAGELFVSRGRELTFDSFVRLAGLTDLTDLVEGLKGTTYWPQLQKAYDRYEETGSVSLMQRRMEEYMVAKAVAMSQGRPLSIGILISYVWAKYNEVTNLRIIVGGKAMGMPERSIREELVLV